MGGRPDWTVSPILIDSKALLLYMGSQQSRIAIAVDLALSGATVLTANTRAARRLRLEAESRVFQNKQVCETPDVLPLEAWVSRTWTECLLAGVADRALLRPNVVTALWEQVIANSASGRELMSHHAAARLAAEAWRLVHEYRLVRSRSLYSAAAETKAFYDWAETFEARCAQEGWVDQSAALTTLVSLSAKLPNRPKKLAVFGFDEFTPLQQELWSALRSVGTEIVLLIPEPNAPGDHAHALSLPDVAEEIRTAALWARRKLQDNPRASIGILVPGLRNLRDKVETILDECLHPENCLLENVRSERGFEISLGMPLAEYPIALTALRVLRLGTSSLPAEEFSTMLRSPYLGGGTTEASGRALLDLRLRKNLRATVTLSGLLPEVETFKKFAPKFHRVLSDLQRQSRKLAKQTTRSDWAAEARRLLALVGWPGDGPEEFTLSSQEFQITSAWDSALSAFGALDQVLSPRPPADIHRELERELSETMFAAENESAPVQVVGPLAASGESFDALWFCGVTDDAWPQRGQANPFLPFALQKQAGVPHSSPEANLQAAERVTARLLQSADECLLSWPLREEDRDLRPSSLLSKMAKIAREDLSLSEAANWSERQEGVVLDEVVDEQAPALTDSEVRTHGTTLLQWQSGCPFRAFAQVRLAAEPAYEGTLGANPRERGELTERALEFVWTEFRSLQNLQQLTPDLIDRGIATAIDRALEDKFPKGDEEWLRGHREIERERLHKLIREWLDVERKREAFRNVGHQEEVEVKIGELTIHGRADRIDQTNDGAYVIVDYKTGGSNYSSSLWELPRPQEPQLPIYAVAQRGQGREIAGVAFARVRAAKYAFLGGSVRKEVFGKWPNGTKPGDFEKALESWPPELERLASQFLAGRAEVDPKHPLGTAKSTCRYCHLGSLCRIAELAAPSDDDLDEAADDE